jgi:hypothetical protein
MIYRHEMSIDYYDGDFVPFMFKINPVFGIFELLTSSETTAMGRDFMGLFYGSDVDVSFLLYSCCFMLIVSAVLNIWAAILIKPVQKLQISRTSRRP